MTVFWLILSLLLIFTGIVGTVIPLLPGIPLIFLGYLIWGLASHWADYGSTLVIVIGVLALLSVVLDYYAGALGAKKFGATSAGIWGAIFGALVGAVFFNIPGLILGPFIGAFLGEFFSGRSHRESLKASWGAFLGFVFMSVFKIGLAVVLTFMFLYFIIF